MRRPHIDSFCSFDILTPGFSFIARGFCIDLVLTVETLFFFGA